MKTSSLINSHNRGQNGFGATEKIVTLFGSSQENPYLVYLYWFDSELTEKNPVSWEIVFLGGDCCWNNQWQLFNITTLWGANCSCVKGRVLENLKERLCVCACTLSRVQLFATPWTIACQTPLSVELSRQEFWSGLPFPLGIQCSQGLRKALTWPWESRGPQACTEIHILKKTWEDTHISPLADLPGSGCQGKVVNLLLDGALKTCPTYRADSPSTEDMRLIG